MERLQPFGAVPGQTADPFPLEPDPAQLGGTTQGNLSPLATELLSVGQILPEPQGSGEGLAVTLPWGLGAAPSAPICVFTPQDPNPPCRAGRAPMPPPHWQGTVPVPVPVPALALGSQNCLSPPSQGWGFGASCCELQESPALLLSALGSREWASAPRGDTGGANFCISFAP